MDNPKKKKQKTSKAQINKSPSMSTFDLREAMKKQNNISMFLAEKVISAVARNTNSVFSPVSISAVLTMVAVCSGEEKVKLLILSLLRSSSTDELNAVFREMATTVLVDGSTRNGGPKIAAINGVWVEQSQYVDPLSKDLFQSFYNADFAQVDFVSEAEKVRKEVNCWAARNTNNLIKNLIPRGSINEATKWIYGNALYFKGTWENKFDKSLTKDNEFHLVDGKSVSVPFMRSYKRQYITAYEVHNYGFKALKLPFKHTFDQKFSLYIYLPESKDGLNQLVKQIGDDDAFLDSHIPTKQVVVGEFRIPKFKIEFGFEVEKVFGEDILELESVTLYHKAHVEIDENGAEAAVSTRVGGPRGRRGAPIIEKIDFVADHPFLFFIREDVSGTVLFVGQIFDPSKTT